MIKKKNSQKSIQVEIFQFEHQMSKMRLHMIKSQRISKYSRALVYGHL